jgi:competence protein ComGC
MKKHGQGSTLAEMPMVIWLIFIFLLMPMLSLATMTLRSALLNAVVQNAGAAAAKAKTFEVGTADKPSATEISRQVMTDSIKTIAGLKLTSVQTNIITTRLPAGTPVRQPTKLALPADASANVYQIETAATCQIEPLVKLSPAICGTIPGVSAPLTVTDAARAMAENPQGLNK